MIPKRIVQLILAQVAVTLLVAGLGGLIEGRDTGLSSLSGGAVGFLSAAAYAIRSSMKKGISAEEWLKAQYAGEKFKFMITVILIIGVVKIYPALHWLAFLLSFMSTMSVYFIALLWDR